MILGAVIVSLLLGAAGFGYSYLTDAPERARAELALGLRNMSPGGYEEAVRHFDRAIQAWPQLAEAYLYRGIAEHDLNEPETALFDFDRALALDSGLSAAYDERGQILAAKGESQKALVEFTKSIHAKPSANGYYQRGRLYELLGEHRKAVMDYDLAIAELSDAPYVYLARATARRNIGDIAGAQADNETATALSTEIGQSPDR